VKSSWCPCKIWALRGKIWALWPLIRHKGNIIIPFEDRYSTGQNLGSTALNAENQYIYVRGDVHVYDDNGKN